MKEEIYIAKENINKCNGCGKEKDTRMGHCFQCADIQSIILEGLDMYEMGLDGKENNVAKTSLEKVKLLNQKYQIISRPNPSVKEV